MNLKVVAERKKEFTGADQRADAVQPAGRQAPAAVDDPRRTRTSARTRSTPATGRPCGSGSWSSSRRPTTTGTTWVSSPFATLEVAAPFVDRQDRRTATVEQGKSVTMTADLDVKTKFDGKAKVELVGLPGNTTAPRRRSPADDKKIEFPVTTGPNTPAAQHKGLFCRVTVMHERRADRAQHRPRRPAAGRRTAGAEGRSEAKTADEAKRRRRSRRSRRQPRPSRRSSN